MPTDLIEKNLKFSFPDGMKVIKYDDSEYYRKFYEATQGDIKAVDFIAISGDVLWLVEVKDYRIGNGKGAVAAIVDVAQKTHDTLAGLGRSQFPVNSPKADATTLATELTFFEEARRCTALRLSFHFEDPNEASATRRGARAPFNVFQSLMLQKLRQLCKTADPKAIVTSSDLLASNSIVREDAPYTATDA